ASAKRLLVMRFVCLSNNIFVLSRCAITPNENTWLRGPAISKGERVFSEPLHASKKLAKWLEELLGTSGSFDAIAFAFSSGIIDKVLPCEPPLKVSSLLYIILPGLSLAG